MDYHVTWTDIALRLGAALIAGALIGYDRSARGEAAGLRTTILLCLAAAAAMIEANLMLVVDGKTSSSFTVLDALRFPLGILTGIGFIGAGAIVRRGEIVMGVTTAATMWLITVIGLIIGGGYILLGGTLTLIAFAVLTILKHFELRFPRVHLARLTINLTERAASTEEIGAAIERNGFKIASLAITYGEQRGIDCLVSWRSADAAINPPGFLREIKSREGVILVEWRPMDSGSASS